MENNISSNKDFWEVMTPACKVKVETVEKIKTEGSEMRQYNL